MKNLKIVLFGFVGFVALIGSAAESGNPPVVDEFGEWRVYGADKAGTKYAPLSQINRENFSQLEIAWRWQSVDGRLSQTTANGGEWWSSKNEVVSQLERENPSLYRTQNTPNYANLQATPLMIGGALYLNTPLSQGAAVDAKTGETLWVFNPKSYEEGTTSMTVTWRQRGVAYWRDGDDERLFWGTGSGHMICVEARTGYPCRGFGDNGKIDLTEGLPRIDRGDRDYLNAMLYSVQSPPIVVRDVVIHGSSIADRRINKEAVPGWVRAWDVRTGEHRWDFHTVPEDGEEGTETWRDNSWRYSGNANVWTYMSADEELGYVYLPTGTPTNDYYGGHRLGDNLFAESIVCIDVTTGKKVWHFQAVHHGLWDYDFPTAANLLDVVVDGKPIKALAQVSKQGFLYAFDRVTGEPIWPIEERPVPTDTNMPGEEPAPTQPFPTKPAPFEYQGLVEDDLVDFTPEIRQMAIEAVKDFRLGPLYTPQMLADDQTKGLLFRPTGSGAANWSGAAVDPETGILYVPSRNSAGVISFYQPDNGTLDYTHGAPEAARLSGQAGSSFPRMPRGLPLLKPPYSRMTAIDMNTGDHVWMTPLGNGDRIRRHRMLRDLDLPPLGGDGRGGPLLTKTLLITALSAGGSDGGARLVAYDKATGDELGSVDLPRGAIGTPMTYQMDGVQYIALTIGGTPPEMVAFKLPESQP
ncbi:MAG: quinoprotein glucose dehydrogenase [Limisphaerales bacterium]|jgi:quinoprotein glucose dehydrogenase